jgi:hypothetical protein
MAELMVMQTASEFGLLQMGSNMFVWHLLESSLEQIYLLYVGRQFVSFRVPFNEPRKWIQVWCQGFPIPHPRSKPAHPLLKPSSGSS